MSNEEVRQVLDQARDRLAEGGEPVDQEAFQKAVAEWMNDVIYIFDEVMGFPEGKAADAYPIFRAAKAVLGET